MAKELGYYVLMHDDHPAVLEIMDDTQYARIKTVEPEYRIVAHSASKDGAMNFVCDKLMMAYRQDPTMQHAKQIIKDTLNP